MHHVLHSHPVFSGILVIDEGSFVPVALWNELARYQLSGAKFLVLGDFRGQFLPAHNSGCGHAVSHDVEESVFLRRLCAHTRFLLTRNHRNDRALFDVYAPLCKGGSREFVQLSVVLKEAREICPAHGPSTWG